MAVPTLSAVRKTIEAVLLPETQIIKDRLAAMEGRMAALESEIKRLDYKVDGLRNELKADIGRLDEKLLFTNKRLDEALEIRERLAALEAKVGH